MVKCMTNDLYVPSDADIILEGYVDPSEGMVWEGPFGDHTGFYSLADWYPKFHVTCITHSKKAIYPATIVGIPPNEDAWLTKTTEKIFLHPVKMALQPEIEDFHMPAAGVAHNLVIIRISKTYPGQGMKVLSSLFGAGQMMFSKYMVVVSGDTDIRDYRQLASHVFQHTDPGRDLMFCRGPLDVLDHSSDSFSFGGKLGIDATIKSPEEDPDAEHRTDKYPDQPDPALGSFLKSDLICSSNLELFKESVPVVIVAVNRFGDPDIIKKVGALFRDNDKKGIFRLIVVVDRTVDPFNLPMVAWQVLGNSDPQRDHQFITPSSLLIDGTIKAFRRGGFTRRWPNVVCSGIQTISSVDRKWEDLDLGPLIKSPSEIYSKLLLPGRDEIVTDEPVV